MWNKPLPSDISSSSRRLIPVSCEGALRLSVGVGNSGKEGGDWGDVSSPLRSRRAVPLPEKERFKSDTCPVLTPVGGKGSTHPLASVHWMSCCR